MVALLLAAGWALQGIQLVARCFDDEPNVDHRSTPHQDRKAGRVRSALRPALP